ncbi:MAG: glycosyltransferase family 2 protein [Verrucomicrobiota bacterium]
MTTPADVTPTPLAGPAAPATVTASVVVPVFNEAASIELLFRRLSAVVATLPRYRWELVLVDDGSTDPTLAAVAKFAPLFSGTVRVVEFSRNFGHQPALLAGLAHSTGDFVIVIDADLQDPPELFPTLVAKYEEGCDVVYAVRRSREASLLMRWAYSGFYRFMDAMTEIRIPLDSGDFGLVSRRVAQLLVEYPDKDLFLRGLRSWAGFTQAGIPYDRPARAAGETKYTFTKLLKLAGSGIFGYSSLPLRFSTLPRLRRHPRLHRLRHLRAGRQARLQQQSARLDLAGPRRAFPSAACNWSRSASLANTSRGSTGRSSPVPTSSSGRRGRCRNVNSQKIHARSSRAKSRVQFSRFDRAKDLCDLCALYG